MLDEEWERFNEKWDLLTAEETRLYEQRRVLRARIETDPLNPKLLADMLSGALCAVALTWLSTGGRKELNAQLEEVMQGCWRMIEA